MVPGQNVRVWVLKGLPAGRTQIVAVDTGGAVWTSVTIDTTPGGSSVGKKYTDDPNEFITKTTTPTAREVVNMLQGAWDALTENGARTLAAQFMAETGGGKYCFNWNLGNVKAPTSQPHMYLHNVWEVDSAAGANAQVAKSGGLAHVATADEMKQHGWKCSTAQAIAVFNPPHPQCRFRAYGSLSEGAQKWLGHHQRTAMSHPDFIAALNDGDTVKVAHILKQVGYYTANESDYARAMTRTKVDVDRALGPLS